MAAICNLNINISLLTTSLLIFTCLNTHASPAINWSTRLSEGLIAAAEIGKPVLLFVETRDCPACEKMKAETLNNIDVVDDVNHSFVPIKLDAATHPVSVEKYGVSSYPRSLIIDSDGSVIHTIRGALAPYPFVDMLRKGHLKYRLKRESASAYLTYETAMTHMAARRFSQSVNIFSQLLESHPRYAYAYCYRGFAMARLGKKVAAEQDFNQAIRIDRECAEAFYHRALLRYNSQNWKGALDDYEAFCQLNPYKQDYPQLRIYFLRTRLGLKSKAISEFTYFREKHQRRLQDSWYEKLSSFVSGACDKKQLFEYAATGDNKQYRGRTCEAWFYAGMKMLLFDKKPEEAQLYFQSCLETGMKQFSEYSSAKMELMTIKSDTWMK